MQTIGLSVIFTWLFNHTRGSVLLAYLLHASVNTWSRIFPIDHGGPAIDWLMAGALRLIAALLVATTGPQYLVRGGQRSIDLGA